MLYLFKELMKMKILYENNDILIVLKESGKPVQNDNSGIKSLQTETEEYTKNQTYVITRLDRPVGGITLFAKNKNTSAKLSKMMQDHKIKKIYYAVVCGDLTQKGVLENYLFKNQRQNITKVVNKGNIGAKLARLEYEPIAHKDNLTLVKIHLLTGRHHQIRVQFSHFKYPLYGDTKYNPEFKHKRGVTTALYASELEFEYNGEKINVQAKPIGEAFDIFDNNI